ncbi:hypothetical protein EI94DRAFT_1704363 [Lactarius quietus]|nr:hypothetical protein EI94DRAFT_1704363 [Lactarius quietus]
MTMLTLQVSDGNDGQQWQGRVAVGYYYIIVLPVYDLVELRAEVGFLPASLLLLHQPTKTKLFPSLPSTAPFSTVIKPQPRDLLMTAMTKVERTVLLVVYHPKQNHWFSLGQHPNLNPKFKFSLVWFRFGPQFRTKLSHHYLGELVLKLIQVNTLESARCLSTFVSYGMDESLFILTPLQSSEFYFLRMHGVMDRILTAQNRRKGMYQGCWYCPKPLHLTTWGLYQIRLICMICSKYGIADPPQVHSHSSHRGSAYKLLSQADKGLLHQWAEGPSTKPTC